MMRQRVACKIQALTLKVKVTLGGHGQIDLFQTKPFLTCEGLSTFFHKCPPC